MYYASVDFGKIFKSTEVYSIDISLICPFFRLNSMVLRPSIPHTILLALSDIFLFKTTAMQEGVFKTQSDWLK